MTKIADVEGDLAQYKAATDERLEKLETALAEMRSEAEKRHIELMKLLLPRSQTAPPPPPPTTLMSLPTSTSSITTVNSQPLTMSSNLVFDEYGLPIHTTGPRPAFHDVNGAISGTFHIPPHHDTSGPRPGYSSTGQPPTFGMGPSGERVWTPGADYRLRKLKMPLFEGEDVYGWVYRMERFFDIQGMVTTGEKLRAVVLCMEGQALSWFRWSDHRIPFRSWEHLKACMFDRFQPSHEGDIYEQFLAIEQKGSVREYIGAFETLAAQLVNIPEKVMEGTFIKGLKPEIRSSVRMLQPTGLTAMIKTALLSEEGRSTNIEDQARGVARVSPPPPLLGNMGPKPVTETTRPPLKRMTEAEILEKRAKGLCFKCNGRFGPNHRCPDKTLQVLLIDDDEEASEGEEEPGGKRHAA